MKTRAKIILMVIGSPNNSPPKATPEIGMMKTNEWSETAPYFLSMVFQATKPKDAVIRLWYIIAMMTGKFSWNTMASSHSRAPRKNSGTENMVEYNTT